MQPLHQGRGNVGRGHIETDMVYIRVRVRVRVRRRLRGRQGQCQGLG